MCESVWVSLSVCVCVDHSPSLHNSFQIQKFDNAIAKLLGGDCTAAGLDTRKCKGRGYAVFPVL